MIMENGQIKLRRWKLCDSSHNFMDRGIKRGKAVHTNTVILVSADAGDGKGKCGFTVILAAVKKEIMILHTTKRRLGERLFCIIMILF